MSTWTYMTINGRGHSLTLVQSHSDSTFSNFFSWETAKPIEAKFYVEPQWNSVTKVCSNGLGHTTKMADMPIYDINMKNYSSLEPICRWPLKLVCSIGYSSTTNFVQKNDSGLTLTYFTARSNLVHYAFVWEKVKTMYFSETIVVYDVKVGRYSQLNEYMNL